MNEKEKVNLKPPKYIVLTLDEATRLIVCVVFDIIEYTFPILLAPIAGDVLDVVGVGVGIIMFGWVGLLSILEFLPGVDIFPTFILTWIVWYYLKKEAEKKELEKLKQQWR